jgi:HK97 gp10 family phage protein
MANTGFYSGIEIKGLEEIERKLQGLEERVRRKYARKALVDAANIVRDEARLRVRKAPVPTRAKYGHISEHIETKAWIKAYRANSTVGVDWQTSSYGHLLEFGHRTKTGETRKFPFMRPAFDAKAEEALELLITTLRNAVEKEASNGS